MSTFTALTTLPDEARAHGLGDALGRLEPTPVGVDVSEKQDGSGLWEVVGHFEASPDLVQLSLLAATFAATEFAVSELPETDWVAKVRRELQPVEAGRFFVYGAHDASRVPDDKISLLVEASMAFGTGHHGTTLGCLRALDGLVESNFVPRRIADIGSGTAVLAMAAARIWDAEVIASDIDRVAVEVAQTNLRANKLETRVLCVETAGFDHPLLSEAASFDLIFANILKNPLIELAPAMAKAAAPGARVILSGILFDQADDVADIYSRVGFNEIDRGRIVDWTTILLQR